MNSILIKRVMKFEINVKTYKTVCSGLYGFIQGNLKWNQDDFN